MSCACFFLHRNIQQSSTCALTSIRALNGLFLLSVWPCSCKHGGHIMSLFFSLSLGLVLVLCRPQFSRSLINSVYLNLSQSLCHHLFSIYLSSLYIFICLSVFFSLFLSLSQSLSHSLSEDDARCTAYVIEVSQL